MEGNYWNKEIETMPREQMNLLQSERLVSTVKRVYENVPYYAKKMKDIGLEPGDIRGTEDLYKLPFTTKADLRDNYPFGTFAVPMEQVTRIHASSGTTGKSTVVGYTKADLEMWAECVARCLTSVGVSKKDIIHISYGYGLFTGGLGLHYGAEHLGASVVPASVGNTNRQLNMFMDFKPTVLCCTPSYALYLGDELKSRGISPDQVSLKIGVFGAEPWSDEMRREIEQKLGVSAHDIYGLSEIMGPGVAIDCAEKNGLHIHSDHFLPEIIDPDTGKLLPDGESGELVFSCITKQALPLLRYRTRDISSLDYSVCHCGRTSPRMTKVRGRSDDMLIIRGVNVFPSQIESVLLGFKGVAPHYMIFVDRVNNTDTMEIHIEMGEELVSDSVTGVERLESELRRQIESTLGLSVKIRLVEPNTLVRSEGKIQRVVDKRKIF